MREALDQLPPGGPPPVVVSEGANTMDMARLLLPAHAPRTRLDAGTWGTMGVGLGYAIAAAAAGALGRQQAAGGGGPGGAAGAEGGQLVVAVEGDSAFGFSGMEVETIVR